MRVQSFRFLMQRLALAATLALALVPTLGRLAQAGEATALRDAWGAMCTVAGLAVEAGAHADLPSAPVAPHAASGDCPYCPLLQQLSVPSAPAFIAAVPHAVASAVSALRGAVAFRHPTGLGSRGPPSVS